MTLRDKQKTFLSTSQASDKDQDPLCAQAVLPIRGLLHGHWPLPGLQKGVQDIKVHILAKAYH